MRYTLVAVALCALAPDARAQSAPPAKKPSIFDKPKPAAPSPFQPKAPAPPAAPPAAEPPPQPSPVPGEGGESPQPSPVPVEGGDSAAQPAVIPVVPTLPPRGVEVKSASNIQEEQSRAQFKAGKEFLKYDKYEDALQHFRNAYAIVASPNALLMSVTMLEKLGRHVDAYMEGRAALSEAEAAAAADPKYQQTVEGVRARLASIQQHLVVLTVILPPGFPQDGLVSFNGKNVPPSTFAQTLLVQPGKHTVAISGLTRSAELALGAEATFDFTKEQPSVVMVKEPGEERVEPVVRDEPDEPAPSGPRYGEDDRGAFVAGGKVGALVSFNGLDANVTGAVEVGYILPFLDRSFMALVGVGYAQPVAEGLAQDPRVAGGNYIWRLVSRQLTVQPSVYYRATMLPDLGPGQLVPYAGAGPRIFFTESEVSGEVVMSTISEQTEASTEIGFGAHLGGEYLIGPGGAVVEGQFGWASTDQLTTGDSNLSALSVWGGYRFML